MNSFENPQRSKRELLNERIVGEGAQVLDELDAQHKGLISSLEALIDPSITNGEFFSIMDEFNTANTGENNGSYSTIRVHGNHGDLAVKYYKNGSVSISGSWRK